MILRNTYDTVKLYLESFPVVAILGSRQCGKSTLAKFIVNENQEEWVFLDLERRADLLKLEDPEFFFHSIGNKRVCIDEVQLRPELFPTLRAIVDEDDKKGKILLLGSASPELLRQGSETLAGRISFIELTPFQLTEISDRFDFRHHWLRGGYPRSVLANSDEIAFLWIEDFLRTYVERDLVTLGLKLSSPEVLRFLMMLAHTQGQIFNSSKFSESMGVNRKTLNRWLDVLLQTFMVRKLSPYEVNIKKRLVKTPKVYIRDSGILHELLGISSFEELMGNPVLGNSWEGYCIENILTKYSRWNASFYRTTNGAELDLILSRGIKRIAVEFKTSLAPRLTKGFWNAIEDVQPDITWVVIPEGEPYLYKEKVMIGSLEGFLAEEY